MNNAPVDPIVLELAPLPREQVGPFLLLGLEKTAVKGEIDAAWAQRLIWARKGIVKTPLEDINWAREAITDPDRRVRADAASLNLDLADGVMRKLAERYSGKAGAACRPLDVERNLADYHPDVEVPNREELRRALTVPEIPLEVPAVQRLLDEMIQEPIDPWKLPLTQSESV